jgi:uncharacterized protein GlcG (DUF336 family)
VITVKRLTLEDALVLLAAAEAKARAIGVRETICVCDDGGHPIALHRMTGARITGVEIAIAKAFTAAGHRRATHTFNQPPAGPALPGNEAFGIHAMHPGRFAVFVGGSRSRWTATWSAVSASAGATGSRTPRWAPRPSRRGSGI